MGLRDFIGTGLYSGEYLVATKNIGSRVKLTAGIGWGRLSGENNFENIFGRANRASRSTGFGGTFQINQFFQVRILHFLDLHINSMKKHSLSQNCLRMIMTERFHLQKDLIEKMISM